MPKGRFLRLGHMLACMEYQHVSWSTSSIGAMLPCTLWWCKFGTMLITRSTCNVSVCPLVRHLYVLACSVLVTIWQYLLASSSATCQTRLNISKIVQSSSSFTDHGYTPRKEVMEEKWLPWGRPTDLGPDYVLPLCRCVCMRVCVCVCCVVCVRIPNIQAQCCSCI